MGADLVSFYFRYKERNPAVNWKSNAEQVAGFIGRIYNGNDHERSFSAVNNSKAVECHNGKYYVSGEEFSIYLSQACSACDCYEFYGSIDKVIINVKDGMRLHYPEYMWELHYYEEYGGIYESICGYDGEREYGGQYEIVNSDSYIDDCPFIDNPEECPYIDNFDECPVLAEPEDCPGLEILENGSIPEYDFSIPQATSENPYPCPRYAKGTLWLNPLLR